MLVFFKCRPRDWQHVERSLTTKRLAESACTEVRLHEWKLLLDVHFVTNHSGSHVKCWLLLGGWLLEKNLGISVALLWALTKVMGSTMVSMCGLHLLCESSKYVWGLLKNWSTYVWLYHCVSLHCYIFLIAHSCTHFLWYRILKILSQL